MIKKENFNLKIEATYVLRFRTSNYEVLRLQIVSEMSCYSFMLNRHKKTTIQ